MFIFDFIINYNKESNIGYVLMADVNYPMYLKALHRDLLFLTEKGVTNGANILVCTLHDKKCVCQIGSLKQALKHGLILKKYIIS